MSWGPSTWYFIHNVTRTLCKLDSKGIAIQQNLKFSDDEIELKEQTKAYTEAVKLFFSSVFYILLCQTCKSDIKTYMQSDSFEKHLDSWDNLDNWGFQLHNHVNTNRQMRPFDKTKYLELYASNPEHEKVSEFITVINKYKFKSLSDHPVVVQIKVNYLKKLVTSLLLLYPTLKNQQIPDLKEIKGKQDELETINTLDILEKYLLDIIN